MMKAIVTIDQPDLLLRLSGVALFSSTVEQLASLLGIAKSYRAAEAHAIRGGGGLPDSYVSFTLIDRLGHVIISGGIDATGDVST